MFIALDANWVSGASPPSCSAGVGYMYMTNGPMYTMCTLYRPPGAPVLYTRKHSQPCLFCSPTMCSIPLVFSHIGSSIASVVLRCVLAVPLQFHRQSQILCDALNSHSLHGLAAS